jgi:hypothetical protein
MTYQFDTYSIGIFGGGCVLGALEYSLDELFNWCRTEEERQWCLHKLHNVVSKSGILDFDYTAGGDRVWHEFSVE